jgi:multiple sugar transport system permease protein
MVKFTKAMPYLLLLPTIVYFIVLWVFPLVFSIYICFIDWNGVTPLHLTEFVGLANFDRMVGDATFWQAAWNTIRYAVVNVPVQQALALGFALLLNQKLRGRTVFRTAIFSPTFVSGVALSLIFSYMFNPYFGLFNSILETFGLPAVRWLESTSTALPSIQGMAIWAGAGFSMIMYLAGLGNIPADYYDAAEVDGASVFARFRHITLPLLKPTLLFTLVTGTIGSLQTFGTVYLMTRGTGGPANSTLTLVLYMYQNAFQYFRMGYAAAISAFLFLIILVLIFVEMRLMARGGMRWW